MRLKNILIVVENIEISKRFYSELFGLRVITDMGENVILSEGLVLQEQKSWEQFTGTKVIVGSCASELYFEEYNLEEFIGKLEQSSFEISYVTPLTAKENGKRVVRLYDPDKHLIEVGER